jgi:DedD protein
MESRAKQRLTGAVILVALFVLLVPELLTGPREAHLPAAPTNDEGLRSYTIDLEGRDASRSSATPSGNDAAVTLPAVPTPARTNSPPATSRAVPGEAATPQAAGSNPPAADPTAEKPVQPAQAAHADAARPEQTHAPVSAPAPLARPAAGDFVVQLGTFGQRENADRLVREMTAKGFAAFVLPITSNGHELYRVRVGPTRDRASAEALAAQLKRMGQSGSIVPIS